MDVEDSIRGEAETEMFILGFDVSTPPISYAAAAHVYLSINILTPNHLTNQSYHFSSLKSINLPSPPSCYGQKRYHPPPSSPPLFPTSQLTPLLPPTAKSRTIAVRLLSMAMTGYFKTLVRPRAHRPLSMLKYDPVGSFSHFF